MSDFSQGPGWWIASDRRWYPPHLHPSLPQTSPTLAGPTSEPPDIPVPARSPAGHRTAWVVGSTAAVVIFLIAVGIGIGLTVASTEHSGALTADTGAVVFSDSFGNPYSGWRTDPASGATYTYENGTYVIVPSGNLHWFAVAPYEEPVEQMSAAVTASENATASANVGFGVMCFRGSGSSQQRFEFVDLDDGQWFIEENSGVPSPSRTPRILEQGMTLVGLGRARTVVGACTTQPDGRTVNLAMFVDGSHVANLTATSSRSAPGWLSAIVVDSRAASPSKVTVTRFEERDTSQ